MKQYCPICGLLLDETSYGRYFCKNHGIVGEKEDAYHPEDEEKNKGDYIG